MKIIGFFFKTLQFCLSVIGIVIVMGKIIELLNNDQYKFDVDSLFNDQSETPTKQRSKKQQFSYEDLFYG